MGLVGESGCGKSTTGRAILNLIPKTGGALKFNNELIYDVENKYSINKKEMQSLRKDMQMIFSRSLFLTRSKHDYRKYN